MLKENSSKDWFDRIRIAYRTDIGLKRSANEDSWIIEDGLRGCYGSDRRGMIFAVADGLGGHNAGHIASRMACDTILSYFENIKHLIHNGLNQQSVQVRKTLSSMMYKIDEAIRIKSHADENLADMGTTLSAMVLLKGAAVLSHVGDSRIYRLRDMKLTQLTPDHTFVQEMIDEGEIIEEDAATHPLRHMLTQALGTEEPIETVFTDIISVERGDKFLLCSDGLTNMVPDDIITEVLGSKTNPENIVDSLVGKALQNGGKDNITVIVVENASF
jgi:PPM family protein phosphatase